MIFGTTSPKIVYDRGGAGEATLLIDYATIERMEPSTRYVDHTSELDRDRTFLHVGQHWDVSLKVFFRKYADPIDFYGQIAAYKGVSVSLWLHRDGSQFLQTSGSDALFVLRDVTPVQTTDRNMEDALILNFMSVNPTMVRTPYDRYLILMDAEPEGPGKTFYFPASVTATDYFLLPLALDGTLITLSGRTAKTFTIDGAVDAGTVRCLFVDPAINGVIPDVGVRVGAFTTGAVGSSVTVNFPTALSGSSYLLLALADDGEYLIVDTLTASGFDVASTMTPGISGHYFAIIVPAISSSLTIGNTLIRTGRIVAHTPSTSIYYQSALPSDDHMLICLASTMDEYVEVEQSASAFIAYPQSDDTEVLYAAFYKYPFIAP
jgi:hypothetical protein